MVLFSCVPVSGKMPPKRKRNQSSKAQAPLNIKHQPLDVVAIKLDDIPTDCLSAIFLHLAQPTKHFYHVWQDPSIRFQLFEILFSSEIGKQVPFNKEKTWKNYFDLFFDFGDIQFVYSIVGQTQLIDTIEQFRFRDKLFHQSNSRLISEKRKNFTSTRSRITVQEATSFDILDRFESSHKIFLSQSLRRLEIAEP